MPLAQSPSGRPITTCSTPTTASRLRHQGCPASSCRIASLRELLRAPDPPRLLLVLSYRAEDETHSTLLSELKQAETELEAPPERLSLGPLASGDTLLLAGRLFEQLTGDVADLEQVLRQDRDRPEGAPELVHEHIPEPDESPEN